MSETYDAALGIHLNVCTGTKWVECADCGELSRWYDAMDDEALARLLGAIGWTWCAPDWFCPRCRLPECGQLAPADLSDTTAPAYYRIPAGATELWDIISALGMSHCHAAALEYVYRAGRKPGVAKIDDLRKAVANLEYEIARLEAEAAS